MKLTNSDINRWYLTHTHTHARMLRFLFFLSLHFGPLYRLLMLMFMTMLRLPLFATVNSVRMPIAVADAASEASIHRLNHFVFSNFHWTDHSNVMSVLIAAKKLSILLQQNGNMTHQPDPFTANVLSTWLQTHLPVCSIFELHFISVIKLSRTPCVWMNGEWWMVNGERCMHFPHTNSIKNESSTSIVLRFSENFLEKRKLFRWKCSQFTYNEY